MKPGFLYYRQIIIAMVLAGLIAGCQTDAGEKPGSITPDGIPATIPPVATAVPALPSPDSTANAIQNDVAPSGWNLEPITAANVQRLSLLARFAEGGLEDEMALSTDGRLLAIATAGGVVLYDAAGGEWVDFYPASSGVTSLAFSPDSQQLAYIFRVPSGEKYSATDPDFAGQEILKPLLTVRSISKGEILYSLPVFGQGCGEYNAWDLTFSTDGKRILFHDHFGLTGFSGSGSLCVLDAESGSLLRAIEPEKPWRIHGFTPPFSDGKTVWAVCVDDSKAVEAGIVLQQLRRYNLESGALEAQLDLPETGLLRLSPDQQWMMMGEKAVQIRSTQDGSLAVEINVELQSAEDNNQFSAAVFSPDSGTLALGAWDGSVSLYSVPQGQPLDRLEPVAVSTILAKEEPLHVVNLRFSADGSILYILLNSYFVDTPEVLRAVRLADGQELFRLSGRNTVERRPSLSPDHALLAWGGYEDGSVQVWSTASGKMIYTLNGHTGTVLQTHFSADGHQLATASMDGTVRLWNAVDGTPLATLGGHEGGVWAIGYSGDGSRLASAGMDGRLILWDAADGSLLKTMEIGTSEWQVNSVQFTTDNRAVLVASGCIYPLNCRAGGAGDLRRIDLESGQMTTLIAEGVLDLSLSADQSAFGGMITGSMKSGQISPGEVQVLREYRSPFGKGSILGAAISPDGSLFFSGNSFGIHVWDTASGQMVALAQNLSQNGSYGSMQMTADGCILLVAGDDGVIYLWGVFSQ